MADTKENIKCPACNSQMKKIYIEKHNINLDICETCGGIFFDNREFKLFDEQHEDISEIENALINKEYKEVDTKSTRICPVCESKMIKTRPNDLEIDECYICGGKFLDNNELQVYKNQYSTDKERTTAFKEHIEKKTEGMLLETTKETTNINNLRKALLLKEDVSPISKLLIKLSNKIASSSLTDGISKEL